MEKTALSYYRIKTECVMEAPNGSLMRKKIEELALASCYTEAETLAHSLISTLGRAQFGDVQYEIIKTKIADVLYNDVLAQDEKIGDFCCNYFQEDETSGVGLYSVKVIFIAIDEKTAKEKQSTEVFYVPALSNADATNRINEHLKVSNTSDFVIRDAKFDKVEAIYWPIKTQKKKTRDFVLS